MTPAAHLYVRRPSGLLDYLIADKCDVKDGLVNATGRIRRPSGRLEPRRSYSWPTRRVVEIQWSGERVAA
jgi:hypothetical protein